MVFTAISKNDGMSVDFSLYNFFSNPKFIQYLEVHLDLVFLVLPYEDSYQRCRELIFESITSLLTSEPELIVQYLNETRFDQLCRYLQQKLSQEFDSISSK